MGIPLYMEFHHATKSGYFTVFFFNHIVLLGEKNSNYALISLYISVFIVFYSINSMLNSTLLIQYHSLFYIMHHFEIIHVK